MSAGKRFRQAVKDEVPLQIPGAINANHALLAKQAGYRAIYVSGGGVAASSLGVPDLGITTLDDPTRYGLAMALGSNEVRLLDLTNAYGTARGAYTFRFGPTTSPRKARGGAASTTRSSMRWPRRSTWW